MDNNYKLEVILKLRIFKRNVIIYHNLLVCACVYACMRVCVCVYLPIYEQSVPSTMLMIEFPNQESLTRNIRN